MAQDKTPLQKLRAARGYSQAEVAKAIGIDQSTYHGIETRGTARKENAKKLADFFGREYISELHVLFPQRYPHFRIPSRV